MSSSSPTSVRGPLERRTDAGAHFRLLRPREGPVGGEEHGEAVPPQRVHAVGQAVRATPHVRVMPAKPAIVEAAWQEFERARGKLSLPDAFVVAWAKRVSAESLTFDLNIRGALSRR